MADIERVKTGIPGFDELVEGGIPKGSFVVLTGGPGTGKTILASQFLAGGIANGENGIFVSVEQSKEEIIAQAAQFGWDFAKMEKEGKLKIMCLGLSDLFGSATLEIVENAIRDDHYSRVVIDSITSLILTPTSPQTIVRLMGQKVSADSIMELRRASASVFIDRVKRLGATTLGIAQKIEGMPGLTADTISEFKCDGLVMLSIVETGGDVSRTLKVLKMRSSNNDLNTKKFSITEDTGIVIE
ncbi:MAG: AAA family ATPase [Candidatus Marsarchaeota archaeon]|nr:AAA family ATPase [Candidatus Marsarchaeota archaeon]